MWTWFMDMHTGGMQKTEWANIIVEANEADATHYINFKWDVHPENVGCACCGEDFGATEGETLSAVARWYVTREGEPSLSDEEIISRVRQQALTDGLLLVYADDMGDEWRSHEIQRHGFRWCDW